MSGVRRQSLVFSYNRQRSQTIDDLRNRSTTFADDPPFAADLRRSQPIVDVRRRFPPLSAVIRRSLTFSGWVMGLRQHATIPSDVLKSSGAPIPAPC